MKSWFEWLQSLCGPWLLNQVAAAWFVLTITGVLWHGIVSVLPVVYDGYSDWVFVVHYVIIAIMFLEMMLNFAMVKFVKSPFEPSKYSNIPTNDQMCEEAVELYVKNVSPGVVNTCTVNGTQRNATVMRKESTLYLVQSMPSALPENDPDISNDAISDTKSRERNYRVVYPYFSWKPCIICQKPRPPRTHHCPLCGGCVLKRDHHCFFIGACVGLRNQRHFVVFNFWASMATSYCFFHSTIYLFKYYIPHTSYLDVFIPFTLLRWLAGYTPTKFFILMLLYYSIIWFWMTTLAFLHEQSKCILQGITSFEQDNHIKVTCTADRERRIRSVFGKNWYWNFLIPLHYVYPCEDNGVDWPHIKA